jgi:hypothetical protein
MIQRRSVLASVVMGVSALSGCLSGDSRTDTNTQTSESTQQESNDTDSGSNLSDLNIQVEFKVEGGDLVVYHSEGDVIPEGESVYVTIEGEIVAETDLGSDVHAGAEVIRVPNVNSEYLGTSVVALYGQTNDESVEIQTGEVEFSSPPSVAVEFQYNADENSVSILHAGGDSVQAKFLTVTGDADNTPIEPSDDSRSFSAGDTIFSADEIQGVESGDEIQLRHRAGLMDTFQAP